MSFAGRYLITDHTARSIGPDHVDVGRRGHDGFGNSVTDGIIPILFPVSNLDMNENANIEDSDLISAIGSATPPDIGQYSGQMNFTTGTVDRRIAVSVRRHFQQPHIVNGGCPSRCRWWHGDQSASGCCCGFNASRHQPPVET